MRNKELKTKYILTGLLPWLFLNIVLNVKLLMNTIKMLFSQEYCKAKIFSYGGNFRLLKDIKKIKKWDEYKKKSNKKTRMHLKWVMDFS